MKKFLIAIIILLSLVIVAEVGFLVYREITSEPVIAPVIPTTEPVEATVATTVAPTTEPTTVPTTVPTEPPEPEEFVLTFVGDCTMGATPTRYNYESSFIRVVGENYDFPFDNVRDIFMADDFTMINFEGTLMNEKISSAELFPFRGPTAYTQILTGSSVEAVTLANNHTKDFGNQGYTSTTNAMTEAGIPYVEQNSSTIVTTESGLVIGLYAMTFDLNENDMKKEFAALREQGAELIVVAAHWGDEGKYRPTEKQINDGHAMIDAGADIIYGHHPHVLQRIEEYNDGIIYYSLGNFSFGGNTFPRDRDSAIVQQTVIRDPDGTIRLGELKILPVCITSTGTTQNNFQPILYEEGSEDYNRTLTKLDGTFTGSNLVVDYSNIQK